MGSRGDRDRCVTAFKHPANLPDVGRVRAQLNTRRQCKRNQSGILAGKEKPLKHRIRFGNDADPVSALQSQAE